jgi:Uma2 family endonuclease
MSSAVKILPNYTYDEYAQWEGRWELIDGIPWAIRLTPEHQRISGNTLAVLQNAVKQSGCTGCKVYPSIDYKITENTVVCPDVLIACQPIEKDYLDFAPVLVAEILSAETILKDRNSKFYLYEAQKIPDYLIVDADKQEIEIYKLNSEGKYILEKTDPALPYTFAFEDDCSAELILNNIWE